MSAAQGVVAAGREAKLLVHFRTSYLTKVRSRPGLRLTARRPKPCTQPAPAPLCGNPDLIQGLGSGLMPAALTEPDESCSL